MAAPQAEGHDLDTDSDSESSGELRAWNRELVSQRPPHVVYCELHCACYSLFSRRPAGWDAAEVTRVSLSLYLVVQGFRRGYHVPGQWDLLDFRSFTEKLDDALHLADSGSSPFIFNKRLKNPSPHIDNATGAVFGDVWHVGAGRLAWVCSTRGGDLELWAEPIPAGSAYDLIEAHLQQLRALVGHLGYTAHVRIE